MVTSCSLKPVLSSFITTLELSIDPCFRFFIYRATSHISTTILLKLPVSVVQGTDLTRLEPARDAVKVKSVLGMIRAGTRHAAII